MANFHSSIPVNLVFQTNNFSALKTMTLQKKYYVENINEATESRMTKNMKIENNSPHFIATVHQVKRPQSVNWKVLSIMLHKHASDVILRIQLSGQFFIHFYMCRPTQQSSTI